MTPLKGMLLDDCGCLVAVNNLSPFQTKQVNKMSEQGDIDSVMIEKRLFPPPADFSASARVPSMHAYQELYDRASADPEAFWEEEARQNLHWFQPFSKTLQ